MPVVEVDEFGIITKFRYEKWEHSNLEKLVRKLNSIDSVLGTIIDIKRNGEFEKPSLVVRCYIDDRKSGVPALLEAAEIKKIIIEYKWNPELVNRPLSWEWEVIDARWS